MRPHRLHAYAIVSDDDRIADAAGNFPDVLENDADWAYFQAGLDNCDLTLLGRRSHDASPNLRRRRRLIMSRSATGLEQRDDGFWWNPGDMKLAAALSQLLPDGGEIGVPGGQDVFDLIGAAGFASFHLARAEGTRLPGGRGLFKACEQGIPAAAVLAEGGLVAGEQTWLDEKAGVSLVVWRRPKTA
jgi:hypothetical protein